MAIYQVIVTTNKSELYFSVEAETETAAREKCSSAVLDRRLARQVLKTSAYIERRPDPHLVYVKSRQ